MAEFCKECFKKFMINSDELRRYQEGSLKIIMSSYIELCEGCGRIKNVVIGTDEK